jgi:hypothetical protein
MGSPYKDYDLLLQAPNPVEAALAKDLLAAQGIPCFVHGRDRDMAELGAGVHDALTRPDVFVPKGELERARAILDAAWSAEPITEATPVGDLVANETPPRARPSIGFSGSALIVLLVLVVGAILVLRLRSSGHP